MITDQVQVREAIQEMVSRIVREFHPLLVILFGSHARGTAGPDSDVDLLVVMPPGEPRRRQATKIDMALWGIDLPADIIVADPEEVSRNRDRTGHLIHEVFKEGQVLYERPE